MILGTEVPYVVLFDTGIIEAYRSASVEFPFTDTLSGLQYGGHSVKTLVQLK
jgi:peptide/nickel transport system substrate-binding protein